MSKHDEACVQRRHKGTQYAYLCTCGLTDEDVAQVLGGVWKGDIVATSFSLANSYAVAAVKAA